MRDLYEVALEDTPLGNDMAWAVGCGARSEEHLMRMAQVYANERRAMRAMLDALPFPSRSVKH